jgi:hypothetical protein
LLTPALLTCLGENASRLEEVLFGWTSETENHEELGRAFTECIAGAMPRLKKLVAFDDNVLLTNEAAIIIGASCPLLTWLSISSNSLLLDSGLVAIANGPSRGKLTHVDLQNSPHVSDDSIIAIARSSPLLEVLDVERTKVTDASVTVVAECCPRLSVFGANNLPLVTSGALTLVATKCRELKSLHSRNSSIGAATILALIENAHSFQSLAIDGNAVRRIGEPALRALREARTDCLIWGFDY